MEAGPAKLRHDKARASAIRDIVEGVTRYHVWSTLAWQDIRQRYRRSVLGPFWITLTMLVTIAGMGPLYGTLLKVNLNQFVPYLALGIITWGLISTLILDGCVCFTAAESIVRSVRLPLTLHVMRSICRNILTFGHNIVAYLPVILLLRITPHWTWLLAIPGVALLIVASFPLSIILGIFCARFRDMQPIVTSVVQLAFFLTPVIWTPEALGSRAYLAAWNPLFLFIEVVREPIYGVVPTKGAYLGVVGVIIGLYLLAFPLFTRFRARIALWI
jgi:ABC-type polysaccharide/polyol phosphate export permease